jgi:hypothetical protein
VAADTGADVVPTMVFLVDAVLPGRRHRDDCRPERDVFPMLPAAVTVTSYLVFQMAEVAVPRALFGRSCVAVGDGP